MCVKAGRGGPVSSGFLAINTWGCWVIAVHVPANQRLGDRQRVPEVKFWLQSPAFGRQEAGRKGEVFCWFGRFRLTRETPRQVRFWLAGQRPSDRANYFSN
jgi:hypothetical protein